MRMFCAWPCPPFDNCSDVWVAGRPRRTRLHSRARRGGRHQYRRRGVRHRQGTWRARARCSTGTALPRHCQGFRGRRRCLHLRRMRSPPPPTLFSAKPAQRMTASVALGKQSGLSRCMPCVVQERHAHRLRIPRRPAWDRGTSPEELDVRERAAFLAWRRDLAQCAPQHGVHDDSQDAHIAGKVPNGAAISAHQDCAWLLQAGGGRKAGADAFREEHRGLAAAVASSGALRHHRAGELRLLNMTTALAGPHADSSAQYMLK